MTRPSTTKRTVARTLLIVGEGYAEEYFLQHLASIYVERNSGVRVIIKNARGKGALNVVNCAIRHARNANFDTKAALLDTDVGWDQNTEKLAHENGIAVLKSSPCLEALLLHIHQQPIENRTTAQLKQAFEKCFGAAASTQSIFARHFGVELLEKACQRTSVLDHLRTLLKTGRNA